MTGHGFGTSARLNARQRAMLHKARRFRRDEEGGLIILTLFFFVTMLMLSGLAVDLMRFESARIKNQSTMDRAVLAAASLDQEIPPEQIVIDYYTKAGLVPPEPDQIVVLEEHVGGLFDGDGNPIPGSEGELVERQVAIVSAVTSPNMFSNWVAIDTMFRADFEHLGKGAAPLVAEFSSVAGSAAIERVQNVEISLVVDISGSMGSNNRLKNLKTAAAEFFETVVPENQDADSATGPVSNNGVVSISVIPYNATVVAGDLLNYLNADGTVIPVANPPTHPGAIQSYNTEHGYSTCIRFDDVDFESVAIDETTPLERISHFDEGRNSYNTPTWSKRWCNEQRASILVHATDADDLVDHINSLKSGGWTGVDNGVKWGAALLDPAFRPVMADMIDDGLVSDTAEDRPNDYDLPEVTIDENGEELPTWADTGETIKIIVVMTDGANTVQRDMKRQFKNGPTKVWHSHDAWSNPQSCYDATNPNKPWNTSCRSAKWDPNLGRNMTWRDGFFVEMTRRSSSQRWFRPGHWNTTNDNRYYPDTHLATMPDALQLDYITLYDRFAEEDVARYFFRYADDTEYNAHRRAVEQFESYGSIDDRLSDICQAARDKGIVVFSLAFEAPQEGKDAMQDCATNQGNGGFYYETDGTGIGEAFRSIAGQITQLRLTQ